MNASIEKTISRWLAWGDLRSAYQTIRRYGHVQKRNPEKNCFFIRDTEERAVCGDASSVLQIPSFFIDNLIGQIMTRSARSSTIKSENNQIPFQSIGKNRSTITENTVLLCGYWIVCSCRRRLVLVCGWRGHMPKWAIIRSRIHR